MSLIESSSGPFTVDDLQALPDDGRRHELVAGALIVTPSPVPQHQAISLALAAALVAACPEGLHVFTAPLDVDLPTGDLVQPDLLVCASEAVGATRIVGVPLLVVEILSPSTRAIDLTLKRSRYEAAGCASYWVIDAEGPRLLVWELEQGSYVERADVRGEQTWSVEQPFPITLVPGDLR